MEININIPLPDELVQEILLRSPVKSLVRFKCVCKSWLSLISDPSFANSHFELSAAPSHRLLFKTRYGSEAHSNDVDASFHDDSAFVRLVHPLPESAMFPYGFQVLGSCRGFVLFIGRDSNLYIWNPSNGFHRRHLSFSDFIRKLRRSHNRTLLIGFGYDSSTDDYLVVVLWLEEEETHMVLFSLRTNLWKKNPGFPYSPYVFLQLSWIVL
ncbi:F-box/kelch-repeat protein At3g23880-like [Gastrolobium bilobum]|uniref:F-box/kelch-repeat protein At3g23880-like n=1 Tax=Gastrolobium bilobum TaxID=150636 RepID=UPI002AB25D80|nr:F-box/kelch-repeat protein At3g23880-like [Gastrolobium bilobum]